MNIAEWTDETPMEAKQRYDADGFYVSKRLIDEELVQRMPGHMEAVLAGEYETGAAPIRYWNPEDGSTKLRMIDQPHLSDRTIRELVSSPQIGAAAAALTGARMIQLWAVSLIYKPSGGDKYGKVGWHQDMQLWQDMWEADSRLLTAWVAVSDVTLESGPVCFVPGSHRWGLLGQSAFDNPDHEAVRAPEGKHWEEVPALLVPGAVSFHDCVTYHGSTANVSSSPRLGFALHLRTEDSHPLPLNDNPGRPYLERLQDQDVCPVLYQAV